MSDTKDETRVQQVEINLEDILNTGAESIMTPDDGEEKKGFFSPVTVDTSFLDKPFKKAPESQTEEGEQPNQETLSSENQSPETPTAEEGGKVVSNEDPLAFPSDNEFEDEEKNKGGRPTVAVGALKSLIDKKLILPFEDDKKLEDYTQADIEELIEANIQQMQENISASMPQHFFANMPVEMQQAYHYIANGGTDLRGLFQSLASSNETYNLDIDSEAGQKHAIRSYLQATGFGTPEEIEDEIYSYEDRGELEKKANQFKPKLDAMQEQIVNQKIAQQEQTYRRRQQEAAMYQENVYNVLEKGELNGLKLDNRVQNMLYSGLVQPNYPSVSGKQTNLLGHLLEKYQFVEPNHELIAEALWLLADPDGYRNELRSEGSIESTNNVARKLKTEQSNRVAGHVEEESAPNQAPAKRPGIQRPRKDFFKR